MILDDLEAYLKLPGNLPVTKIKLTLDNTEKTCPGFVPVLGEKKAEKTRKKALKKEQEGVRAVVGDNTNNIEEKRSLRATCKPKLATSN